MSNGDKQRMDNNIFCRIAVEHLPVPINPLQAVECLGSLNLATPFAKVYPARELRVPLFAAPPQPLLAPQPAADGS